jgi:serine/threonine protein kinase/tetratricopeptide (TPR) repeat protein
LPVKLDRDQRVEQIVKQALDAPPYERQAILNSACEGDPELRVEVDHLVDEFARTQPLAGSTAFEGPTGSLDDAPTVAISVQEQEELLRERDIGPYRIVRRLGQGGMGDVYLAERIDAQFRKQVAIKLIKLGMDTEFVVRRFRNERQILASLDHPNIARLLDGGTTNDGRPYFVMEYIEGETICAYSDGNRLSTVERLELFQKICAAVHYAHQNLVIHRDIKPSNILVTRDGVPKLLDFGIAKLLNPELAGETVEATAGAIRLMTPEYASPEQVKGEQITTATDVYALGVVLYELLTGHRPYRLTSHQPHEIVRVICGVEPERPSTAVGRIETVPTTDGSKPVSITPENVSRMREGQPDKLRRRLRGDLDNIVLMAMRKEPSRRYLSVAQLSNDIQRHLEHKPVIARADTFWYRSGKFVRRNKLAVVAVALIFLTLIGGIVSTTIERRRAERRFNDVRQLTNSFLFEFHDAIKDLPGSTAARELVVKKAIEYLDSLAGEASGDASLQRELAAAYDKVGDLQGGLYQSSLGDTEGAQMSYQKALRIREALAVRQPSDTEVKEGLSASYARLGGLTWTRGEPAGAAEWHHKALAIDEQLLAAEPNNPKRQYNLGATLIDYGFMLAASDKVDEGLEVLKEAMPIFESLVQSEPTNQKYQDALATAYERVATVLVLGVSEGGEALDYYRKSLAIREKLFSMAPINTDYIRGVAASYSNIGDTEVKMGNQAGAIESYEKALNRLAKISEDDPQNLQFRQDAAVVAANLAASFAAVGKGDQAFNYGTRAREDLEKMLAGDPTSVLLRFRVAIAHESLGDACLALSSDTKNTTIQRKQYLTQAKDWY